MKEANQRLTELVKLTQRFSIENACFEKQVAPAAKERVCRPQRTSFTQNSDAQR